MFLEFARLFADGVLLTEDILQLTRDGQMTFSLPDGLELSAGQSITATQGVGEEESAPSTDEVLVLKAPPSVGPLLFRKPVYECSEAALVSGAEPWVQISITSDEFGQIGDATSSARGSAGVYLSVPATLGDTLRAVQIACDTVGMAGGTRIVESLEPLLKYHGLSGTNQLPSPRVEGPLRECQSVVEIGGVVPGSTVSLERTMGETRTARFASSAGQIYVSPALQLGERLSARQTFKRCELTSAASSPVEVEPIELPRPHIHEGGACAGSSSIRVSNLYVGALLRLFLDGEELGQSVTPASTWNVPLPPIAGGTIAVQQSLCDVWSELSSPVELSAAMAPPPAPKIPGPLYECAVMVAVEGLDAWSHVWIKSELRGGVIGESWGDAPGVDVEVPPLQAGDELVAVIEACGNEDSASMRPTPVLAQRALLSPEIDQPRVDDLSVSLRGLVPGAYVEVFVDSYQAGATAVASDRRLLELPMPLRLDQTVSARQWLCARHSPTAESKVLPPPPTALIKASPTKGAAPLVVEFTSSSSGAIDSLEWWFDYHPGADPDHKGDASLSHEYTQAGDRVARLRASGPGGSSAVKQVVSVAEAPPPDPPDPPGPEADKLLASGVTIRNCHTSGAEISLWLKMNDTAGPYTQLPDSDTPKPGCVDAIPFNFAQNPQLHDRWMAVRAFDYPVTQEQASSGLAPYQKWILVKPLSPMVDLNIVL